MTTDNTHESTLVRLRSDGAVGEEMMAYARTKIDAVVGRPGLPTITGEVHIVRVAFHHAGHPWSATADLRIGGRHVVAVAEEATGKELVDRLQDRLRRRTDKAAEAWDNGDRTTAPPWRGGSSSSRPPAGSGGTPADSPTA